MVCRLAVIMMLLGSITPAERTEEGCYRTIGQQGIGYIGLAGPVVPGWRIWTLPNALIQMTTMPEPIEVTPIAPLTVGEGDDEAFALGPDEPFAIYVCPPDAIPDGAGYRTALPLTLF